MTAVSYDTALPVLMCVCLCVQTTVNDWSAIRPTQV